MLFIKKHKWYITAGILSGFVNGLLGAGGGIIVTHFLSKVLAEQEKSNGGVFANAIATMLPISIFSFAIYLAKGYFSFDTDLLQLLPPSILGGILGAFLLSKVSSKLLKFAFSLLVIISGITMIFR